jgi:nucleotide-binding universal stress UspA family protein
LVALIRKENAMAVHSAKFATAYADLAKLESRGRADPAVWQSFTDRKSAFRPRTPQKASRDLTFREVIVPLDGSAYAEYALPWAIHIAALASGRVRLVHAHQRMHPAFHSRRLRQYTEFDRLLREPMEEYLADVARRVARASEVPLTPTIVDVHDATNGLSDFVASTSDLVVMATRGRNFVSRFLIGSALDAVIQRRETPILHVRGYSCPVDLTARPSLRHALVPIDDAPDSADVLPSVAALNALTPGRQTLLRVLQSDGLFPSGDRRAGQDAGKLRDSSVAWLDDIAKTWRGELPRMRTSVVWSEASPADAILTEVEKHEVDFIAMTTRCRGTMRRLLRPGVFDRLVRRAGTPILVVKQHDDGEQSRSLAA